MKTYPTFIDMVLGNPIKTASVCFAFAIGMVLVLGGCTMNSAPDKKDLNETNLVYFKDSRTGICYAALNSTGGDWMNSTTITYVPCTPEVEKLIK